MVNIKSVTLSAEATEKPIFTLVGQNSDGITVCMQNRSSANFFTYRFQESQVNIDDEFTNIEEGNGNFGVSGILAPLKRAMVNVRTSSPYIRLVGDSSGGADIEVDVIQLIQDGSNVFNSGTM